MKERSKMKRINVKALAFMVAMIVFAGILCAMCVRSGNLFNTALSIILVFQMGLGLGYVYSKNEDAISDWVDGKVKLFVERREAKKAAQKIRESVPIKIDLSDKSEANVAEHKDYSGII